jgi:hypothetical protein
MNEITSDEMTENSIKRFEIQIKTLEKKDLEIIIYNYKKLLKQMDIHNRELLKMIILKAENIMKNK